VIDHVTIRASDRGASERFYETVLPVVGLAQRYSDERYAEWGDFSLAQATAEKPATRGLHIAFTAPSREVVDEFWRAGTNAGYRDDGAPGPRPQYSETYYGGFLLDPDGNSAEAVHHDDVRRRGPIDHLWIRVGDVEAATRFYETISPYAGFALHHTRSGFAHFKTEGTSFSLVADGPRTENLHLAFGVTDNAAVDAFHRAATDAGYRDNGPAGERAIYHPGYYGAYVRDPDGNNVEVVNHNRR
jgi:catechol 2,3-dioxygenase-like lactoylglutathione lyase family enzyme